MPPPRVPRPPQPRPLGVTRGFPRVPRRLTSIFGGESKLLDIGRETNTIVSDMTTVICLDDYHKWDRTGQASTHRHDTAAPCTESRALHATPWTEPATRHAAPTAMAAGRKSNPEWPNGITALHADCQKWDKMAADVTDLKAGKTVMKPIYNHITGARRGHVAPPAPVVDAHASGLMSAGLKTQSSCCAVLAGELDPDEEVKPTPIVIFEGLHPMYDDRVNDVSFSKHLS